MEYALFDVHADLDANYCSISNPRLLQTASLDELAAQLFSAQTESTHTAIYQRQDKRARFYAQAGDPDEKDRPIVEYVLWSYFGLLHDWQDRKVIAGTRFDPYLIHRELLAASLIAETYGTDD